MLYMQLVPSNTASHQSGNSVVHLEMFGGDHRYTEPTFGAVKTWLAGKHRRSGNSFCNKMCQLSRT